MEQRLPSHPWTMVRQFEDQHSEGPTQEKSTLEGLCPVEGTRTEAVDYKLEPMRRTATVKTAMHLEYFSKNFRGPQASAPCFLDVFHIFFYVVIV